MTATERDKLLLETHDAAIETRTELHAFLAVHSQCQKENKDAHAEIKRDYQGRFRAFWVALGTLIVGFFLAFIGHISAGSPK